jgi:hypothetical protein
MKKNRSKDLAKLYNPVKSKLDISILDRLFSKICKRNNTRIKMYNACDQIVELKLSIDHILSSINEFEKFKKVALSDYENSLFTSMRNFSLEEHKELLESKYSKSERKLLKNAPSENDLNGFANRIVDFTQGKN